MDYKDAMEYYELPAGVELVSKAERDKAMGGTDVAALFAKTTGLKWASPLTVFYKKTGRGIDEGNRFTRRGAEREEKIREYIQICLEKQVLVFNGLLEEEKSLRVAEKPHMIASLDGLVIDGKELKVLEIKTCNKWSARNWRDNSIPKTYQIQAQWYMHLSGLKKTLFVVEIDKWEDSEEQVGEQYEYITRTLEYDESIGVLLEGRADRFWFENVLSDIRPEPLGLDCERPYLDAYGEEYEKTGVLTEALEELIDAIQGRKKVFKAIEKEVKELEEQLKKEIAVYSRAEGKRYMVTYKANKKEGVDIDRMRQEAPEVYEEYKKYTENRVLRINEKKEK